jgi:hypothetical protein
LISSDKFYQIEEREYKLNVVFQVTLQKCGKIKMPSRNNSGPVRMVLLENFGAEPRTVKFRWSNSNNVGCLLPRNVAQSMMPGMPKFRKESHPERARDKRRPIFHAF